MEAINVDQLSNSFLALFNKELAAVMCGDCVIINSSMFPPLDDEFRVVIEDIKRKSKNDHLIVLLQTSGGLMETVERLVAVMRAHYDRVSFVIPNYAFSAGTVLALSGDKIYMDYYFVLGPIDPQFQNNDGTYLPGQGYLAKFKEITKKINNSKDPQKVQAEIAFLVQKFDPAQLFSVEQSVQHGITLITEWLPKYKFKDWRKTATKGIRVTDAMRKARAKKIARTLGNASKWHSHGRGISLQQLGGSDIKLRIDDFSSNADLSMKIKNYHGLAADFILKTGVNAYIHSMEGIRRVA